MSDDEIKNLIDDEDVKLSMETFDGPFVVVAFHSKEETRDAEIVGPFDSLMEAMTYADEADRGWQRSLMTFDVAPTIQEKYGDLVNIVKPLHRS